MFCLCWTFFQSPEGLHPQRFPQPVYSRLTGRSNLTVSQCLLRPRIRARDRAWVFVSSKMARGLRRPGSRARSKVTELWRSPARECGTQGRWRGPEITHVGKWQVIRWKASKGQWGQREETHLVGSGSYHKFEGRLWRHPVSEQRPPAPDTQTQTWRSPKVRISQSVTVEELVWSCWRNTALRKGSWPLGPQPPVGKESPSLGWLGSV